MKLWDLAEFYDSEYLSLYIAEEIGAENFVGSIVVCPRDHSFVIPGVAAENLITLKIAFSKQRQRFFLAMLHAYLNFKITKLPVFLSASDPPSNDGDPQVAGLLSSLCELFRNAESKDASSLEFCRLFELIQSDEFLELGELGVAFTMEIKKASLPYVYYSKHVLSGQLFSSGQLRSAEIAVAVATHWRFLLDDAQWTILYREFPILQRLQRISVLLSKCFVRPDSKQYNYESKYWPYLFAATAGWFYRMAIIHHNSANVSSSTLCLTRAFELALQAQSLLTRTATLENNGAIYFKQTELQGCGKIVDLVQQKILKSKIHPDDCNGWVVRARTLLSVRNHSRLAHGVGDIKQEDQAELMKETKALILEFLDEGLDREFSETYSELILPPFREHFRKGVERVSVNYID